MNYRGYTAHVEFDSEENVLLGRVADISDVVTFEATSVDDLEREFRTSVDEYIAFCEEKGRRPEKPFSGRFVLRITAEEHRAVASAARLKRQSLNTWIRESVRRSLDEENRPAALRREFGQVRELLGHLLGSHQRPYASHLSWRSMETLPRAVQQDRRSGLPPISRLQEIHRAMEGLSDPSSEGRGPQ